jgi:inhibitor of KinA sporulation pathway (predicted exonuclease)
MVWHTIGDFGADFQGYLHVCIQQARQMLEYFITDKSYLEAYLWPVERYCAVKGSG